MYERVAVRRENKQTMYINNFLCVQMIGKLTKDLPWYIIAVKHMQSLKP